MHRRYRQFLAAAAAGIVTATVVAQSASIDPHPSTVYSPTGATSDGTVLPNGRLVTPTGSVHDVGDFPLGVAVSPDGRLVAAINSGYGMGVNTGFNSYCGQAQNNGNPPPCPYLASDRRTAGQLGSATEPTYDESISVLDTHTGAVSDVKAVPTRTRFDGHTAIAGTFNFFYVGVTFSPDGRHLYAAGGGNDSIYDFPVAGGRVASTPARTVVLPSSFAGPKVGPLSPNYPIFGTVAGFTKGMAVTPDGRYLLVSHEFNNTLDIVDTQTYAFHQVPLVPDPAPVGGFYPYGVAVSPDGATAYVAGQGLGVVAVVTLSAGNGVVSGLISVGDHPTALAMSPDGTQLFVANADDDTLSIVDTATRTVANSMVLHVLAGEQLGSVPNAVTVSNNGQRVYVALAGDDAVAVLGTKESFQAGQGGVGAGAGSSPTPAPPPAGEELPNTAAPASPPAQSWVVGGMIPAGWYPSGVATSPDDATVYVVSAKGLGSRSVPPLAASRGPALQDQFEYDGDNMPGILQSVPAPTSAQLLAGLQRAQNDILLAGASDSMRSPANPIPPGPGGSSPITHVIEVVRENRTFDQELGDLGVDEGRVSTQVEAEPAYTEIGRDVTPNVHAISGDPVPGHADPAFATSDNFYSDGEASVQGHWWTAAANVNDYVEKSWRQYYSLRNHVYDPESTVSQPKNCTIFQSAQEKALATAGAFTYRNYGELIGLLNISVPGVNQGFTGPTSVPNPCSVIPNSAIDPNAVQDESLDVDNRSTAGEFLSDVGLNPDGSATGQPGHFLRNFSYITLSGDHTGGLSFAETPRSRIAENDAGLGLIVQALSRSSYWSSTAVMVMEDDSQDGLDHEDGHRNLLYVISPWAKHVGPDGKPGYVGHVHYSQASVLKTVDLILGLPYLSAYDQNASALYDLFQDKNTPAALTREDLAPYTVQPMPSFVPEKSACYTQHPAPPGCPAPAAGMTPAVAADLTTRSGALDMSRLDAASPDLELILWQLSHPDRVVPAPLQQELAAWLVQRSPSGQGSNDG